MYKNIIFGCFLCFCIFQNKEKFHIINQKSKLHIKTTFFLQGIKMADCIKISVAITAVQMIKMSNSFWLSEQKFYMNLLT